MKTWNVLAMIALVAVGCGKKSSPENAGTVNANNEISLGALDLNRKPVADAPDKRVFEAHLHFKNTLSTEVTVTKVDWHTDIGDQTLGDNSKAFSEKVAAGASADLELDAPFAWKDGTEVKSDNAHLTGTVTWTGPKGNANTSTFDLHGTIPAGTEANEGKGG